MGKAVTAARKKKSLKIATAKPIAPKRAPRKGPPPFADKIPFIRSLILDSVKPGTIKKIYLFGSYAYGKPTKESDVDVCVVIGDELDRASEYLKIARNLFLNDIIPADVLVYNEKIFYDIKNPNGIENTIINKGIRLYG